MLGVQTTVDARQMLYMQSTMTPRPSDMFSSRFSELIEDSGRSF